MHEIRGDLFASVRADAICLTTNGFVKRDGACVMGRGCAAEAVKRWPGIQYELGQALRRGNFPHLLTRRSGVDGDHIVLPLPKGAVEVPYHVLSFPVKPATCSFAQLLPRYQELNRSRQGDTFPGFMAQACPEIIAESARLLAAKATVEGFRSVVIPKPGCGAGGLNWELVKPILEKQLDDRFWVIDFPRR